MSPTDIIKAFGEYRAPLLTVHMSDYYSYGGLHTDEYGLPPNSFFSLYYLKIFRRNRISDSIAIFTKSVTIINSLWIRNTKINED